MNTSSCANNKAMGNVTLRITSSAASEAGPLAPPLQHVFVTVRGIEAHPNTIADEDSPDWQELAPDLTRHPRQIDLMAQGANSCAASLIHRTPVPAFVYRQVRLRLVPGESVQKDAAPPQNACGNAGFNCVVAANGSISPLKFEGSSPEIHITSERMNDGFFRVLPDTDTNLTLEFDPFSSLAVPSGDSVQILPLFNVDSSTPCDSAQHSP